MKTLTRTEEESLLREPEDGSDRPPLQAKDKPAREINVIDLLTLLAYRKRLVGLATGVGILVGGILCVVLPPKFTAVTKIMPPQQAPSMTTYLMNPLGLGVGGGGSLAAMASAGLGLKSPNDLYIGVLNSRPIADALIQKFDLVKEYHSRDMSDARKKLKKNTEITSGKDGLITVSVEDNDKKRVPQIANAYIEELRKTTKSVAITEASQRRLFYEEQLKQAKDALVAAAVALQRVQQEKGMIQPEMQARSLIGTLTMVQAQIGAKQVELQALRSYSTEQNPEVQMAEKQLESLRGEATRLEQNSHSSGFSELGMKDVPGASVEFIRAEHEVLYRQTLFDLLVKQYDSAKLDEAKEPVTIQVLEPAIEPDRKTSPSRMMLLLIAMVVGFMIGCLWALIVTWLENLRTDPVATGRLKKLKTAIKGMKA
jgi:uncharacterized protein involved in exopolysaccharide biosynthesis